MEKSHQHFFPVSCLFLQVTRNSAFCWCCNLLLRRCGQREGIWRMCQAYYSTSLETSAVCCLPYVFERYPHSLYSIQLFQLQEKGRGRNLVTPLWINLKSEFSFWRALCIFNALCEVWLRHMITVFTLPLTMQFLLLFGSFGTLVKLRVNN